MRLFIITTLLTFVVFDRGYATSYQAHIMALPGTNYEILIDEEQIGKMPYSGDTTIAIENVNALKRPLIELKSDSYYGKIRLGYPNYGAGTIDMKNIHSVNFKVSDKKYYEIVFQYNKNYAAKPADTTNVAIVDTISSTMAIGLIDSSAVEKPQNKEIIQKKIKIFSVFKGVGIGLTAVGFGTFIYGIVGFKAEVNNEVVTMVPILNITDGMTMFIGGLIMTGIMNKKRNEYNARTDKATRVHFYKAYCSVHH
jgi:hypothetical protein